MAVPPTPTRPALVWIPIALAAAAILAAFVHYEHLHAAAHFVSSAPPADAAAAPASGSSPAPHALASISSSAHLPTGTLPDATVIKPALARIRGIAKGDFALAMLLAQQEPDLTLRKALLQALLADWSRADPPKAIDWLLNQNFLSHAEGALSIFNALASDPSRARSAAELLIQRDPHGEENYGAQLVHMLGANNKFHDGALFAATSKSAYSGDWAQSAYENWGSRDPLAAAQSAAALPAGETRTRALSTVTDEWAAQDPHALAQFALTLPADATQGSALAAAIETWAQRDLNGARDWLLAQHNAGPALDEGIAAVATRPDLISADPKQALTWSALINDDTRRSATLSAVITQWASTDSAAATAYAQSAPGLTPAARTQLLSTLSQMAKH